MEISNNNNPLMNSRVVIAYDATKSNNKLEFWQIINGIRSRGDILRRGDTIVVLGVLHKFIHPFGYPIEASPESIVGAHIRRVEEEVSWKVDHCVKMLRRSARECETHGVDIEVKITAGTPIRRVVLQEVIVPNVTWVVFDRSLRRDLRHYLKQIPCKTAIVQDNLSTEVVRPYIVADTDNLDHKVFFSMSKPVLPSPHSPTDDSFEQPLTPRRTTSASVSSQVFNPQEHRLPSQDAIGLSPKQEISDRYAKGGTISLTSPVIQKNRRKNVEKRTTDAPMLCIGCGIKTEPGIEKSMRFSFSEIQSATRDFSEDNLLGEGGYGHVYKGQLKDGQLIAAKVRKEASTQGYAEFSSEINVLSFARHKNIVMLLGYCCKENVNILVYEFICNNSLEWHLFDNTENVLEWHRRYAIAIGTAKGLRFLHEECRGSPIIYRDMRPSNILLTHDFVPMLGDFGLAKWKKNDDDEQTRVLGTFGYIAPEYAETGIVSVRTDVYAFGMVLIQLMSGRKVFDSEIEDTNHSLRQWAMPLIERLALHELVDSRLGESYETYELYNMARTAYMCVQADPEMRPSMREVLHLLEGENDYHYLADQFIPHFNK